MPAVLLDNQGRVLTNGTGPFTVDDVFTPPTYTGTVDVAGLTALGWDSDDIDWLQKHVWWDKEDNEYWKVTEANLAFGPNGSTPLTWANRATIKDNPDVRYFPKFNPSPNSNTSWSSLFSEYMYLYAIPTHGWDTSHVTSFYYLFYNCLHLSSIGDLTNWVTSSVTSFRGIFAYTKLRYIGDLSGWNTANVTTMQDMFAGCRWLTYIGKLSNWNTAKVTTFYNTFYMCYWISDLGNLSNWDTSIVTTFAQMFYNCNNLRRLIGVSNWDVSNASTFSGMFYNCYNLRYIDNLTNWNVAKATNFASMFYNCYNLINIGNLSNWNTSKLTNAYNMFYSCNKLTNIGNLSNWDVSKVNGTNTTTGLIAMFAGCTNLNPGTLSNWSPNLISTNNQLNSLFSSCVMINKLSIKNWDVSNVKNFTYTFNNMRSLDELDISGWDLSNNQNSGTGASYSIFAECYAMKTLKLGPKFFASSTVLTYYFNHLKSWTRDSMIESLYTNQTLRNDNSTLITINLHANAFDRLKNDLPEGFTLTSTTQIDIPSKQIKIVRV